MITADQLASMRATVSSALPDTCTIGPRGTRTFNPTTGTYSDVAGTPVYSGPCRIRPHPGIGDIVVQAGEEPVTLNTYDLTLPWDATGVEVDHIWTGVTSSDPDLVGRQMRVTDVRAGSWQLGRRVVLENNLG
jgi:hypothetical protein